MAFGVEVLSIKLNETRSSLAKTSVRCWKVFGAFACESAKAPTTTIRPILSPREMAREEPRHRAFSLVRGSIPECMAEIRSTEQPHKAVAACGRMSRWIFYPLSRRLLCPLFIVGCLTSPFH